MTWYVTQFTVKGRMRFPLDMLRYDGCHPATSLDVENMDVGLDPSSSSRERDDRPVTLVRYHKGRDWRPTVDRWASFGYEVIGPLTRPL